MRFGSVCSGIEAASVAWHPLGWTASFVSEIEAFPRAVLSHHYPETPLHGDFTTIEAGEYEPIDLLVGGTPCQSFSVAGLRGGLDDERGNLALEYLRLADRLRPRWLVWENVPGVLSSNGGRDFGSILGGLVELGYGFAYRVLDAQFFGVAQRRRRVFVVGYAGDWRRAAAVLFERHSLQGHPAPSRQTGERAARPIAAGSKRGSGYRNDADTADNLIAAFGGNDTRGPIDVATACNAHGGPMGRLDFESETFVCQDVADTITSVFYKHHGASGGKDSAPRNHVVSFALRGREGGAMPEIGGDQAGALRSASGGSSRDYVAFDTTQVTSATNRSNPHPGDPCHPLARGAHPPAIAGSAVRRLTPRECERLQGFPDDYTMIPWRKGMAPDGPRYKALGNSMAVPVMAWIGRRIEAVEAIAATELAV